MWFQADHPDDPDHPGHPQDPTPSLVPFIIFIAMRHTGIQSGKMPAWRAKKQGVASGLKTRQRNEMNHQAQDQAERRICHQKQEQGLHDLS
jgi:hypothetical protein